MKLTSLYRASARMARATQRIHVTKTRTTTTIKAKKEKQSMAKVAFSVFDMLVSNDTGTF